MGVSSVADPGWVKNPDPDLGSTTRIITENNFLG